MVSAGGGFMSDYDVVNVNVPPPPKCDWLPNDGAFTTHEHFVPSLATGSAAEFDRLASEFYDADVEDVLAATQSENQVSDMILDLYLSKQDKIRVGSTLVGAEHVTESPCDDRGNARPLLFHFSHSAMQQLGQTASDRPGTCALGRTGCETRARGATKCRPRTSRISRSTPSASSRSRLRAAEAARRFFPTTDGRHAGRRLLDAHRVRGGDERRRITREMEGRHAMP